MRRLGYLDGIGTALAILALLVLGWFATRAGAMADMYRAYGTTTLPLGTRVVLHPAFYIGLPSVVIAALVLGHVREMPRYALLAIGIVALLGAILVLGYAWAPVWALAGNIRAE